jgi:predicted TIM-barrel fold metal-dependent hydrolase
MASDTNRPGKTPKYGRQQFTPRIITLEDHFESELYTSKLPSDKAVSAALGDNWLRDRSRHLGHDMAAELRDIGASRIAAMDAAGIDLQVLSLTTPGAQAFEGELAVQVATDANERMLGAVRAWPGRFEAFAALPTAEPAAAVRELERTVKQLGFKGAMINSHTRGAFLDHERYWPIFQCAQALDVPIYLHPNQPHPLLMQSYFAGFEDLSMPVWGFAVDASTHFLRILFSGAFDAFPRLRFILGHLGEGLPFGMDRLLDHAASYVVPRRGLRRTPEDCLRENLYVTTSGNFSVPAFMCTVQMLGVDNVMFSVDWPYESNKVAVEFLRRLPISTDDLEKIAYRNAARVLRVQP